MLLSNPRYIPIIVHQTLGASNILIMPAQAIARFTFLSLIIQSSVSQSNKATLENVSILTIPCQFCMIQNQVMDSPFSLQPSEIVYLCQQVFSSMHLRWKHQSQHHRPPKSLYMRLWSTKSCNTVHPLHGQTLVRKDFWTNVQKCLNFIQRAPPTSSDFCLKSLWLCRPVIRQFQTSLLRSTL
jgi:hypothetical protein